MKAGKAFEIFVKGILTKVGFLEVNSDGLYIFDGTAGQMIQGLGEAHNADVLLEPPAQTPFLGSIRLLIECKDYKDKIGLGIIRGVLGLREDINHFDIVDIRELTARGTNRRSGLVYNYERFSYQVAVAAINGFTVPAQNFAATHRIPLIEFNKMSFWGAFNNLLDRIEADNDTDSNPDIENQLINFADNIGDKIAIAITNTGQLLFLYRVDGDENDFSDTYSLYWENPKQPWELISGEQHYLFQLPDSIMKKWLDNATNDLTMRRNAIKCKVDSMSHMIVYYTQSWKKHIKMISIDKEALEAAKREIEG